MIDFCACLTCILLCRTGPSPNTPGMDAVCFQWDHNGDGAIDLRDVGHWINDQSRIMLMLRDYSPATAIQVTSPARVDGQAGADR